MNGQDLAQVSANWQGTLPAIASAGSQQIASQSVTAGQSVADSGSIALAATVANDTATASAEQAVASLAAVAGSLGVPASSLPANPQSAVALTAGGSATSADRKWVALPPSGSQVTAEVPKPGDRGRATRATIVDNVMSQHADFGNELLDPLQSATSFDASNFDINSTLPLRALTAGRKSPIFRG